MQELHFVTHFQDLSSWFTDLWLPKIDSLASRPHAVLLPSDIAVDHLKMTCAQHAVDSNSISFFTPRDLRTFLQKFLDSRAHEYENYKVIPLKVLKFWVQNILRSRSKQRGLKLQAIQGDPEIFLQAFALWRQTHSAEKFLLFDDDFSFFARKLDHFLFQHHWVLSPEEAYCSCEPKEKVFQDVFIGGFSQVNWDDLPLIRTLTQLSQHSTFVNFLSDEPRWDALLGKAIFPLRPNDASPSPKLFWEFSTQAISTKRETISSQDTAPSEYLSAENIDQEITQVCQKLQSLMASPLKGRIAIILPREASLEAILLPKKLQQMGIPFTSSLALPPHIRTYPVVNSWCQWQKSDHIDDYFKFIQSLYSGDFISASTQKSLKEEMTLAITELGPQRSSLLLDWLSEKTKNDELKSFLKTWNLWPVKANVQVFQSYLLENIDKNFGTSFPQEVRALWIEELEPLQVLDKTCSRISFIEFFETSFKELISKATDDSSPFAKICLITYEEAYHGTWQYVFFFRSAEEWPHRRPWSANPLLEDTNWSAHWKSWLNHPSTWSLKKYAIVPLRTQEKDHFLILSAKKFRQKFSQKNGYFFSVFEKHEADSSHLPSDASLCEPPHQKNVASIRQDDENSTPAAPQKIFSNSSLQSFSDLKEIYRHRRDPQKPFGAWDYSLEAPLWKYFSFPCKTWESILQYPEESWYRHILKQEPKMTSLGPEWQKISVGIWVHDFLSFPEASEKIQNLPDLSEGYEHIRSRAKRFRKNVETFFSKHGMRLHTIWEAVWNEALQLACRLFRRIAFHWESCKFQSEFVIPDETYLSLPSGTSLALKGRIDLWLQRGTKGYVIDYKTGGDRSLTGHQWYRIDSSGKAIVSAKSLQLLLYGIALHNKGWNDIRLMILKPDTPMGEKIEKEQLCLATLKEDSNFTKFLSIFENIVHKGILGLRPIPHLSSKHFKRPLATLPIENHILQKRCLKTFTCLWE
ncbi:MAG: PD-(D/E)XK nuclease family protein [Puniceicoccales bacterium]|jgi:hypothetical protein|nr:PD-(D/E)XK nuclease family protein [Puniceicoccales bacterium]